MIEGVDEGVLELGIPTAVLIDSNRAGALRAFHRKANQSNQETRPRWKLVKIWFESDIAIEVVNADQEDVQPIFEEGQHFAKNRKGCSKTTPLRHISHEISSFSVA